MVGVEGPVVVGDAVLGSISASVAVTVAVAVAVAVAGDDVAA